MTENERWRKRQTRKDIETKLKGRSIELVEMGRTVNDVYTFKCLANSDHGNWSVTGRNVLYLKSGCPQCWQVRRRKIRRTKWREVMPNAG
jgi:hypothetical protein